VPCGTSALISRREGFLVEAISSRELEIASQRPLAMTGTFDGFDNC
jgi:hypothetical protein